MAGVVAIEWQPLFAAERNRETIGVASPEEADDLLARFAGERFAQVQQAESETSERPARRETLAPTGKAPRRATNGYLELCCAAACY